MQSLFSVKSQLLAQICKKSKGSKFFLLCKPTLCLLMFHYLLVSKPQNSCTCPLRTKTNNPWIMVISIFPVITWHKKILSVSSFVGLSFMHITEHHFLLSFPFIFFSFCLFYSLFCKWVLQCVSHHRPINLFFNPKYKHTAYICLPS